MSEMLAPGAQVAGYRITGLLGQGGMGFVYEAEHAVLGRKPRARHRRFAAFTPGPAPVTAAPAPAPPAAPGVNAAPAEPFGTYAVPRTKRRRGIASRQRGPMLASWAAVAATAAALAVYFANH